jgi:hypothetical protein
MGRLQFTYVWLGGREVTLAGREGSPRGRAEVAMLLYFLKTLIDRTSEI